jgi:hypothetical protein
VEALAVVVPADQKIFSSSPGRDLHLIPPFITMNQSRSILRFSEMAQDPMPAERKVREYGAVAVPRKPMRTDVPITTIYGMHSMQA